MTAKKPKSAYREQYGIIILCDDETHQQRLYEKLKKGGHKLRVVVT